MKRKDRKRIVKGEYKAFKGFYVPKNKLTIVEYVAMPEKKKRKFLTRTCKRAN